MQLGDIADFLTNDRDEQVLRRRSLLLAWLIVVWDVVEAIVAITAGTVAGSIALVGFGIDSVIEVFAAGVVIWQLRGDAGESRRRLALRLIAVSFFALAAYVAFQSVQDLVQQNKPGESLVGIILNAVALVVMVPVAMLQGRTGRALGNDVVIAQSRETWVSNLLSISLLVGLGLNAYFGLWWADPVVALLIAAVAVSAGWEAWSEAGEHVEQGA